MQVYIYASISRVNFGKHFSVYIHIYHVCFPHYMILYASLQWFLQYMQCTPYGMITDLVDTRCGWKQNISRTNPKKKATEPVIFEPILIHVECLNHSAYIFSEVFRETHLTIWNSILQHAADGRNPAPVDRCSIPEFIGFQPSQVVQDFFHPP